jgi:hypothetical protein
MVKPMPQSAAGERQCLGRQVARVERGDDHDGAQVVDDRDRGQQHLWIGRCGVSDQIEDAEREGNVGRCRMAAPRIAVASLQLIAA